jgi:hypothetical protein
MSIVAIKTFRATLTRRNRLMGGLVISSAACRAISARKRTLTHITVSSSVLCTGYVVNKTVFCVLMNMILVTIM